MTIVSASSSVAGFSGQPFRCASTRTPFTLLALSRQCLKARTVFSYSCVPAGCPPSSGPAMRTIFFAFAGSAANAAAERKRQRREVVRMRQFNHGSHESTRIKPKAILLLVFHVDSFGPWSIWFERNSPNAPPMHCTPHFATYDVANLKHESTAVPIDSSKWSKGHFDGQNPRAIQHRSRGRSELEDRRLRRDLRRPALGQGLLRHQQAGHVTVHPNKTARPGHRPEGPRRSTPAPAASNCRSCSASPTSSAIASARSHDAFKTAITRVRATRATTAASTRSRSTSSGTSSRRSSTSASRSTSASKPAPSRSCSPCSP